MLAFCTVAGLLTLALVLGLAATSMAQAGWRQAPVAAHRSRGRRPRQQARLAGPSPREAAE